MKKMLKSLENNQRGFTLVELMVVVLIVGILVAIAVPVYNSAQKKAKETACRANIKIIKSAILQAEIDGEDIGTEDPMDSLAKYFDETPECPDGGDYTITNSGGNYTVECSKHPQSESSGAGTGS